MGSLGAVEDLVQGPLILQGSSSHLGCGALPFLGALLFWVLEEGEETSQAGWSSLLPSASFSRTLPLSPIPGEDFGAKSWHLPVAGTEASLRGVVMANGCCL